MAGKKAGGVKNGRKLTLNTCGAPNRAQQFWMPDHAVLTSKRGHIELAGSGAMRPSDTGMCVDLTDGPSNPGLGNAPIGKPMQMWQCYQGNTNQVFDVGPWCRHC